MATLHPHRLPQGVSETTVVLPTGSGSISLIRCLLNDWGMLITPLRGSAYCQSIKHWLLMQPPHVFFFTPNILLPNQTYQIFRKVLSVSNKNHLLDKKERKVKYPDVLNTSPL